MAEVELSVVITVYNASRSLEELNSRLHDSLSELVASHEVIYVEDRSPDSSWDVLRKLVENSKNTTALRFTRNFGQHSALSAGLLEAQGKYVVLMDCDLQDEPEQIKILYENICNSGVDIVYAKRTNRAEAVSRSLSSRIFYNVISALSGITFDPEIGTFRIVSRKAVEAFNLLPEKNKFVGGLFYWMGFESETVEIPRKERKHGRLNYSFTKLLALASHAIFSFSNRLLRLSLYFGIASSLIAFLLGFYAFYNKLMYDVPMGYTSIVVSIYFIGGLLLVVLGIIGEYIGEIFEQVKARPSFLISERVVSDE